MSRMGNEVGEKVERNPQQDSAKYPYVLFVVVKGGKEPELVPKSHKFSFRLGVKWERDGNKPGKEKKRGGVDDFTQRPRRWTKLGSGVEERN